MTRPRRSVRFAALIATAMVAFSTMAPARPALAASAVPPFDLKFPQETNVTTLHNDFGARRSGGRRHKGNDLMAPKMTAVYAAADGIVETIAINRRAGRYVLIQHRDGWTTMYAHLNNDNPGTDDGEAPWSLTISRRVKEGAFVEAGQLIGWVGDSGNAEGSGSHTHFELAHNGQEVNPYPYLKDAWERDHELYLAQLFYLSVSKAFEIV